MPVVPGKSTLSVIDAVTKYQMGMVKKTMRRELRRDPDGVVHLVYGRGGDEHWLTICFQEHDRRGDITMRKFPNADSDANDGYVTCIGCIAADDGT